MRPSFHLNRIVLLLAVPLFLLFSCRTVVETEEYSPVIDQESRELVDQNYKAVMDEKPSVDNARANLRMLEKNKYRYETTIKKYIKYEKGKGGKVGMHSFGVLLDGLAIAALVHQGGLDSFGEQLLLAGLSGGFGVVLHIAAGKNDTHYASKIKKRDGPVKFKYNQEPIKNKPIDVSSNGHINSYQTNAHGEISVPVDDFGVPSFMRTSKAYTFHFALNDQPFINTLQLNSSSWMEPYGVVSRDKTPLQKSTSQYSTTLAKLPGGFNAPVVKQDESWNSMVYKGDKGWVRDKHLNVFYFRSDLDLYNCQTDQFAQYTKYFEPKSEFEYQKEYKKRLEEGRKLQASVLKDCMKQARRERKMQIKNSYEQIKLAGFRLGDYDLSDQTYSITVKGETYRLKMDRDAARQLKQHREDVRISAVRQLQEDGESYDLFNMELTHPVTGKTYAFGQQKEPLYVDYEPQGETGMGGIPELEVTDLSFSEPSGNDKLDAGEDASFTLKIKNKGNGRAQNITASMSSQVSQGLSYEQQQYLSGIAPGKSRKVTFSVSTDKKLPEGDIGFDFSFREANGFPPDDFTYPVTAEAFKAPRLALFNTTIEEQRSHNNNGQIEKAEVIRARMKVINQGEGTARDVHANLHIANPNIKLINSRTNHALGKMEPGAIETVDFSFAVNKEYDGSSELPVQLTLLSEDSKQYGGDYPLKLSLHRGNPPRPPEFIPDVDQNIPTTGRSKDNAVAVVIGNEDYKETEDVEYAINDAETVKQYLVRMLGYKEENVYVEKDASKGVFETYFGTEDNYRGKLYHQVKPGKSEVFVYYSGHGAPDVQQQKGYFVPVECDPQYVAQGGYQRNILYNNLARLPARKTTVVVDACFSGKNILGDAKIIQPKINNPSFTMQNGVLLTSSRGNQVSRTYNEKQHSLYTYYFLKALKEKETTDQNGDGQLTYGEIHDYVSDNSEGVPYISRSKFGSVQMPTITESGADEVFITY